MSTPPRNIARMVREWSTWASMSLEALIRYADKVGLVPVAGTAAYDDFLCDLYSALDALAVPRAGDDRYVRTRRRTCGAFANALGGAVEWQHGDPARMVEVWRAAAETYALRGDRKSVGMARNLAREADELADLAWNADR